MAGYEWKNRKTGVSAAQSLLVYWNPELFAEIAMGRHSSLSAGCRLSTKGNSVLTSDTSYVESGFFVFQKDTLLIAYQSADVEVKRNRKRSFTFLEIPLMAKFSTAPEGRGFFLAAGASIGFVVAAFDENTATRTESADEGRYKNPPEEISKKKYDLLNDKTRYDSLTQSRVPYSFDDHFNRLDACLHACAGYDHPISVHFSAIFSVSYSYGLAGLIRKPQPLQYIDEKNARFSTWTLAAGLRYRGKGLVEE
jgi:hypothetical protein